MLIYICYKILCCYNWGGIALFIYFSKEFSGTRSRKHMSCYCISRNCKHKLQLQTQVALAVAVAVAVAQVATRDDSKYVIFLVSRVESYLYGKEGCVGGDPCGFYMKDKTHVAEVI